MAKRPIDLSRRALRYLQKLTTGVAEEILQDMEVLRGTPWPGSAKVKKLRGRDLYRLRTGDCRSIFEVRQGKVVILRIVGREELERILRSL